MIIDQFNADSNFTYSVLPGKDRHLKFEKEKCPSIHIFTDDHY